MPDPGTLTPWHPDTRITRVELRLLRRAVVKFDRDQQHVRDRDCDHEHELLSRLSAGAASGSHHEVGARHSHGAGDRDGGSVVGADHVCVHATAGGETHAQHVLTLFPRAYSARVHAMLPQAKGAR
jgi:hypothetical protein